MAWQDRLREATYTTAAGDSLSFAYEDVSREINLRGTAFDFPDVDGTFVQRLRNSGRRYPLAVYLSGPDHDLQAAAFEALLEAPGLGRLAHPLYGVVDVVPLGTVTRRDDLKTQANQSVLEVTFWATSGLAYPTAQSDPAAAVGRSVSEFNVSASDEFASLLGLGTAAERVAFRNTFEALLAQSSSVLAPLVSGSSAIASQFLTTITSIETGIDSLLSTPSTLARQLMVVLQAPSRLQGGIGRRLASFSSLLASVTGLSFGAPSFDSRTSNVFHTRDLYASTFVVASTASVVGTQFERKTDALLAAAVLLDQLDQLVAWRDAGFVQTESVDTGAAYQNLVEAVSLAAGFLVDISFSLKRERRIVLDRARTIIDLAAELYGSVDDQLDFLIDTNNLTGSEILELPRGREIVYYV